MSDWCQLDLGRAILQDEVLERATGRHGPEENHDEMVPLPVLVGNRAD
jgi:hypothetical protein